MRHSEWSALLAINLLLLPCLAQTQQNEASWQLPRTEYGQPDLQGTWYFGSSTPLTRPTELGEQLYYSTTEAADKLAELQQQGQMRAQPLDADRPAPPLGAPIGQEAELDYMVRDIKMERIDGEYRTSLVVEPADGQIPANPEFKDFFSRLADAGVQRYNGPDSMDATERCLVYALAVPSLFPMPWNAHLQIVQNRDYIMIMTEMIHDARIVRLDSAHRNDGIRRWLGDSIGYWENDTLVVETRDFRPEQSMSAMLPLSEAFTLIERFTRLNSSEILYSYTIDDPIAFTQPFTVERTIQRVTPDTRMYEFACHEGNYSMAYSLIGARYDDLRQEALADEVRNPHLSEEAIVRLAGNWHGEVNGAQLQFRFSRGTRGGLLTFLDIPNRGLTSLEVTELNLESDTLAFTVPGVAATFRGEVTAQSIAGEWSREDYALPLTLQLIEAAPTENSTGSD